MIKEILCKVDKSQDYKRSKYRFLMIAEYDPKTTFKIFINEDKKYYICTAIRNKLGKTIEFIKCSELFDTFEEAKEFRISLIDKCKGKVTYLTVDFLYSIYDYEFPLNEFEKDNLIIVR